VVAGALALSACSFPMSSLISGDDADAQPTGSLATTADEVTRVAEAPVPTEADLAYARAIAADAIARGGKDTSVPWQNPQTGAGGNITPLATTYVEDGLPCRDFLASYEHAGGLEWLHGAACRTGRGGWEVTRLKPLKPS
jgi:surface antigen